MKAFDQSAPAMANDHLNDQISSGRPPGMRIVDAAQPLAASPLRGIGSVGAVCCQALYGIAEIVSKVRVGLALRFPAQAPAPPNR
jgi:hypothetical protein